MVKGRTYKRQHTKIRQESNNNVEPVLRMLRMQKMSKSDIASYKDVIILGTSYLNVIIILSRDYFMFLTMHSWVIILNQIVCQNRFSQAWGGGHPLAGDDLFYQPRVLGRHKTYKRQHAKISQESKNQLRPCAQKAKHVQVWYCKLQRSHKAKIPIPQEVINNNPRLTVEWYWRGRRSNNNKN